MNRNPSELILNGKRCQNCGKPLYGLSTKWCSDECGKQGRLMKQPLKICANCGGPFRSMEKYAVCCSSSCARQYARKRAADGHDEIIDLPAVISSGSSAAPDVRLSREVRSYQEAEKKGRGRASQYQINIQAVIILPPVDGDIGTMLDATIQQVVQQAQVKK